MAQYESYAKRIPWTAIGRKSVACRVGQSIVPVGTLPFKPIRVTDGAHPTISQDHPEWEKFLMNIVGTAIHGGDHKFVTCRHVVELFNGDKTFPYFLSRLVSDKNVTYMPYPVEASLLYLDPRSNKVNADVDLAIFISSASDTRDDPFDIPVVKWGNSERLGVGDPVIVGGYPYGTNMFQFVKSNRGFIQPTFQQGIVSAILPAIRSDETRLIQLSIPCAGGMSGGAVFDPRTGRVLGMVIGNVSAHSRDPALRVPLPISYAIPSEVIVPYIKAISFETRSGKRY